MSFWKVSRASCHASAAFLRVYLVGDFGVHRGHSVVISSPVMRWEETHRPFATKHARRLYYKAVIFTSEIPQFGVASRFRCGPRIERAHRAFGGGSYGVDLSLFMVAARVMACSAFGRPNAPA